MFKCNNSKIHRYCIFVLEIIPTVLQSSDRDPDTEDYNIAVGFTFTDNDWKYAVMISCFHVNAPGDKAI